MSEQAMECLEMVEADMRPVEIKSKDILRIGKAHPKADELVMRYASIGEFSSLLEKRSLSRQATL